jgi:YD repeat-containing protein
VNPGSSAAATTFSYDAAGNITSMQSPDGSTLTYTYDTANRLTAVTNSLGERVVYTLNAMGSRTEIDIRNSADSLVNTQTAIFDELNRAVNEIGGERPVDPTLLRAGGAAHDVR